MLRVVSGETGMRDVDSLVGGELLLGTLDRDVDAWFGGLLIFETILVVDGLAGFTNGKFPVELRRMLFTC